MTIRQVIDRGFMIRKENGPDEKLRWMNEQSCKRFLELHWVLEARKLNMKAAHRRWLRRMGRKFR